MLIEAGFDIAFECPAQTPMLLQLNVHPSRDADLLRHRIASDPPLPMRAYLDLFGNRVTRVEVPAGLVTFSNRFVIADSGEPDETPSDVRTTPSRRASTPAPSRLPFALAFQRAAGQSRHDLILQLEEVGHVPEFIWNTPPWRRPAASIPNSPSNGCNPLPDSKAGSGGLGVPERRDRGNVVGLGQHRRSGYTDIRCDPSLPWNPAKPIRRPYGRVQLLRGGGKVAGERRSPWTVFVRH